MLAFIIIGILTLMLFAYVAIPLIFSSQADPLPDNRDPLSVELEEERDALLRAIKELSQRELSDERREALKLRYEAKAAKVLRALDERKTALKDSYSPPRPKGKSPLPVAFLALLALMLASGALLGKNILPTINQNATSASGQLTSGPVIDLSALEELETRFNDDPSLANRLALADAYWDVANSNADEAKATQASQLYEKALEDETALSLDEQVRSHFRLGLVQFQQQEANAITHFEKAYQLKPDDLDIVFVLGESYFSLGRMDEAISLYDHFLTLLPADEQADEDRKNIEERLAAAKLLGPRLKAVEAEPGETSFMDLADAFWQLEQRDIAMESYLRVLLDYNRDNPLALSRVGQAMFFNGNTQEAVGLLAKARELEKVAGKPDLNTLLFLGNAYFTLELYESAINIWQEYIEVAGGEDKAGRVPSLIEGAKAKLSGNPMPDPSSTPQVTPASLSGLDLFAKHCVMCHGAAGQGGASTALVGSLLAQDKARLENIIRNGRGFMPAFEVLLSADELTAIIQYVSEDIQP
ncbi:MAG: c-type cytochrome [Deinococcales bacterium]